jgi:hypothetical protein
MELYRAQKPNRICLARSCHLCSGWISPHFGSKAMVPDAVDGAGDQFESADVQPRLQSQSGQGARALDGKQDKSSRETKRDGGENGGTEKTSETRRISWTGDDGDGNKK